ncbi:hypothetical protein [Bifidobacterium sp. SO1]|uniref:hypothetical protein n=1 Tax=Bifidobacterium sp. SO1 TaxID=2809029 RepID=UPI001BDD96D1|nr:hypothetical protein [Bifidobacterium sp. SO1]MBT1162853.1 hypothetical protein [Bifidobacterium sp. SO1]
MDIRKIMRRIPVSALAFLTVGSMLFAGLPTGTAGNLPFSTPTASAATVKPAYATAKLVKVADGTGHGTSAQTFVNSDNGFAVGDDSPTDGVVSSGDTIEYKLSLSFTAAAKRQVKVAWDLKDAPYLEAKDAVAGFCTSGQLVTASRSGNACTYTVPAGAVETIQQTLVLTAKDTGGTVQTGQKPKLTVSRVGETGSEVTYPTDEATVVSAPAADLVIDNGGYPDKPYGAWERRTSWVDSGNLTGYFDLKVKPLTYPGYTTSHGASTTGKWDTIIDVSRFPQNTTFTMDGKSMNLSSVLFR